MQIPHDVLMASWFLAGPTACGKTDLSLHLADRLNAEIVCLDSMTLYRGMDVGTAKPSREVRAAVPHHLLDLIEPHQEFSVAEFVAAAEAACREIIARRRTPLFVGGTGLYLRAVLRGVFDGPPADWSIRERLQAVADAGGGDELHDRLRAIDPITARRLPPGDLRRVIRALEVAELTGRPLSQHHQEQPLPEGSRPPVFWLSPPRAWLHARINLRVERMMEFGLVEEVRRLLTSSHGMGRTARQGLGYKEVIAHLEGEHDFERTVVEIQTRTRQFAKRQHTWFRNLVECRPMEVTENSDVGGLADRIVAAGRDLQDRSRRSVRCD